MKLDTRGVTRRSLLAAGAAMAATPALAQECRIGPPPHQKGPLVYLDYDQIELDAAYDQQFYAPGLMPILKRYVTNSELARSRIGKPQRVAYGSTPIEALDIYRTSRSKAPVVIYIHGGEWRLGRSDSGGYLAEAFVRAGAHFVAPDFISVTDAGGSLMPMADQVRRAVAWVYRNADSFGADSKQIYVSGHSSGAHLAGVALVTDWPKEFDLPVDTVKGGILCSGMFDLAPVRLSARSKYVAFSDEMVEKLSPQRHLDKLNCPVIVAHGSLETPEFQRQSRDFVSAAKATGRSASLLVGQDYNHFELIETMANPYGIVGKAAFDLMKLTH